MSRLPILLRALRAPLSALMLSAIVAGCPNLSAQSRDTRKAELVTPAEGEALATFAGGCFWCMEPPFEGLSGVRSVLSGYTGGKEKDPSYSDVAYGRTGHTEAVQVVFDPRKISYRALVDRFLRSMDPTDKGGQFADRGRQYRPGIFAHDEAQAKAARAAIAALDASGRLKKPVVVPVERYDVFYPAERYHQDYYRTNADHYKRYSEGSGRGPFLRKLWGQTGKIEIKPKTPAARPRPSSQPSSQPSSKPSKATAPSTKPKLSYARASDAELRKRLTAIQYKVARQDGTEPSFDNPYWNNKKDGLYVDVVSGEPLFSSRDKFASGTGWPSFTRPMVKANVLEKVDSKYGMTRTEVRSKHGDSHLGHLFDDGPAPTGQRYCINSASLRFVPVSELEKAGYGRFKAHFTAPKATSKPGK